MWVDDQGVCHTVALPDATELMSETFRGGLDLLLAKAPESVEQVISEEEAWFFEEVPEPSPTPDEADFVGAVPPAPLLVEPVATIRDLQLIVRAIDRRWRLDAVLALEDYIS